MLAAPGVFGTGTGWPDIIVAAIMGGLGFGAAGRSSARPAASCSMPLCPSLLNRVAALLSYASPSAAIRRAAIVANP